MPLEPTTKILANITDAGLFERLATAILREDREANPDYSSLAHPGVNTEGKTVKSPVDGICFIPGANPPHMIAVHHTIAARDDLKKKWLHDPSKVKPHKNNRPAASAGDLIKTAELVAKERQRIQDLQATLILTTNKEPREALIRDVEAAGCEHKLIIDLWTCSRLAHSLDKPAGQWIRRLYLGIEQELLSSELLHELSRKSLEIHHPLDNPVAWIHCSLDTLLANNLRYGITFLLARSGMGKSVACYQRLAKHVENGGNGIVIPHEVVASSVTVEQAITTTLTQLHPALSPIDAPDLSFCSLEQPLLLVVEDINRSGQTQVLLKKLLSWGRLSAKDNESRSRWKLLCPLWPEAIESLDEQAKKKIGPLLITANGFTSSEGREAVLARARLEQRELTPLKAEEISYALGHDPLLIALHDQDTTPDSHQTIGQFIEGALSRAAAERIEYTATDYREALRILTGEILIHRRIEPAWREVREWPKLQGEPSRLLSYFAHKGELFRLIGPSDRQQISFRHDRVRDWLLADAATDLEHRDLLEEHVIADPYFAEVMGAVLLKVQAKPNFLQRIFSLNPLALFHAFRLFGQISESHHKAILQAIHDWLDDPTTHNPSKAHLRWEAQIMLASTDSPEVPTIIRKFREQTQSGQLACLRNGDISGGITFCTRFKPGINAPWRDNQIEHAKLRYGEQLSKNLGDFLKQLNLASSERVGALRLAGHIADPSLALAIETCWLADKERGDHLADYLWAFAECCGDNPKRFLGPVCDAWASLSDQSDRKGSPSPRNDFNDFAVDELCWVFRKWPPVAAIDYFIDRASQNDLRWPITFMLHDIDHPSAVSFILKELASIQRQSDGNKGSRFVIMFFKRSWSNAHEDGRPMSKASRDLSYKLWMDEKNDKHLRTQAFSVWEVTQDTGDLELLRSVNAPDELADAILKARLTRGDQTAIPAMIEKLEANERDYWWWWYGKYTWSPKLTEALDNYFLVKRENKAKKVWGESFNADSLTYEMVIRLPENEAERILLTHWDHLRFSPYFVQAALYIATQRMTEIVQAAITECPEPANLMEDVNYCFGIKVQGHPGLVKEAQVLALTPYLHLLSPVDIWMLWEACNERGWFTIRRKFLDDYLQEPFLHQKWERERAVQQLDEMVAENRSVWDWVDDFLKTDVSWNEILTTMTEWLAQRCSFEALKIVADAVAHKGTRKDLDVLKTYEDILGTEAEQLIADTQFAVCRRSIF